MVLNEGDDVSLAEKTFTFKIEGQPYVIVSADSATAVEYRNKLLSGVTMTDGKIAGHLNGLASAEPFLVSRCLWQLDPKTGNRTPVTLETVNKFPPGLTKAIYKIANEISDLKEDDPAKEKTKNS